MRGETSSVLGPPPDVVARDPWYDPDWYEKIERAKQAREIGEKMLKNVRKHNNTRGGDEQHDDLRKKNSSVRSAPFRSL